MNTPKAIFFGLALIALAIFARDVSSPAYASEEKKSILAHYRLDLKTGRTGELITEFRLKSNPAIFCASSGDGLFCFDTLKND